MDKNKPVTEPTSIPDKLLIAQRLFERRYRYTIGPMSYNFQYVRVLDPDVMPTTAVDKYWRFYYSDEFLKVTPEAELVSIYFHECMHLFYRHLSRMQKYHPIIGNMAGDMVINQVIIKEEHLPEIQFRGKMKGERWCYPGVKNKFPEGLIEEEYAKLIDETCEKIPVSCGSGATGRQEPWEIPGQDKECPSVTETEGRRILEKTARNILDNAQKSQGNVPDYMVRLAEQIITPEINFEDEIRHAFSNPKITRGRIKNSYTRPTRRVYLTKHYPTLVFPGKVSYKKTLGLLIDTSGSMSDKDLAKALGCVNRALMTSKYAVIVGCADAELHGIQKVKTIQDVKLKGGGGTSMRQAVLDFQKQYKTDLLCIVTDCMTDWPDERDLAQDTLVISILSNGYTGDVPGYMKEINFNKCSSVESSSEGRVA